MVGFTLVRAVESGQVKVVGTPKNWAGGGIQVWVQHDGFFSRSLHLASYAVREGQFVREGDVLGVMGRTPNVDLHLHLEITLLEQDLNLTISKDKSKIVKASKGT
ncbi:MAG: M23 family metallopeptidase, partial [Sweet potato little leaf phytoplasma]|nr:M23 family metallopeptidase [Sweet potato little leaf phytoplasma]